MTTVDLVTILGNISRSMDSMQLLITGAAYVLGIFMFITGLAKLKKVADSAANSSEQERVIVPIVYFAVGAGLLYFPTFSHIVANTVFGANNVLQYISTTPFDYYGSMVGIIRVAGLVWFVRGCLLMANASEPGKQQGLKGMAFLSAGILSMNYYATVGALDYTMDLFVASVGKLKEVTGY